ncbi:g8985 [Coccomyxa viridis]|uniref:G8985 protein n=1 Tax=Coccomyxa viridis TaxID=1274662 RepID=A0ABP1G1T2_9CHLO
MSTAAQPSTSGKEDEQPSRVLYIGHLPHGFYEEQIKGFFSQFGNVTNVRVSRNKKTGKAKHYAFLEFQYADVAATAAEAMHDYMLFTQKLVVRVVPSKEVHKDLWKGSNRKFSKIPWHKIEVQRHNAERTPEQQQQRLERALRRDKQRQKRILDAGIEYDYKPLEAAVPPKAKHIRIE